MFTEELRLIDEFVLDYATHNRDRSADIIYYLRKVKGYLDLCNLDEADRAAFQKRRDDLEALQRRPTGWLGSTASMT